MLAMCHVPWCSPLGHIFPSTFVGRRPAAPETDEEQCGTAPPTPALWVSSPSPAHVPNPSVQYWKACDIRKVASTEKLLLCTSSDNYTSSSATRTTLRDTDGHSGEDGLVASKSMATESTRPASSLQPWGGAQSTENCFSPAQSTTAVGSKPKSWLQSWAGESADKKSIQEKHNAFVDLVDSPASGGEASFKSHIHGKNNRILSRDHHIDSFLLSDEEDNSRSSGGGDDGKGDTHKEEVQREHAGAPGVSIAVSSFLNSEGSDSGSDHSDAGWIAEDDRSANSGRERMAHASIEEVKGKGQQRDIPTHSKRPSPLYISDGRPKDILQVRAEQLQRRNDAKTVHIRESTIAWRNVMCVTGLVRGVTLINNQRDTINKLFFWSH